MQRRRFLLLSLLAGVLLGPAPRAQVMRPPQVPALVELKDTSYPIPTDGTAYFAAPSGLDTNTGTNAASPWPLKKALDTAPAGSTLVLRGGDYRGLSRYHLWRRVTIQAFPHEKPWVKGSEVVTGWAKDGTAARWVKTGWTHAFPWTGGPEYINPAYPLAGSRDMVFVNNAPLVQVGTRDAVGPGKFFVDAANDKLYVGDDPAGKTVEASVARESMIVTKWNSNRPSGAVVRGVGFTHYAETGLIVGAPDVVLENNTFAWNADSGASIVRWTMLGTGDPTDDVIVRGNTFRANGHVGLVVTVAHRLLLENNTFSNNNVESFARDWAAAGVKAIQSLDMVWRGNRAENNYATGMWMDVSCIGATVVHNTCRYNNGFGIFVELSHNALVAFNLCYANNTGIGIADSSSNRVYNNTLSKNGVNLLVKDSARVNDASHPQHDPVAAQAGATWVSRNNVCKNNLLSGIRSGSTGPLLDAAYSETGDKSSLQVAAANYNAYYRPAANAPASVIKWSSDSNEAKGWVAESNYRYASVPAFRLDFPAFEANALVINDPVNPFFGDETNGDFYLRFNSPALSRGEALPPDIAQAANKPISPVHLGALPLNWAANAGFEASGASQTPPNWYTWTLDGHAYADYTETGTGPERGGGYHGTHYSANPYDVFTHQTFYGLPGGAYTLSAWVRSSGGQSSVKMLAKDFGGAEMSVGIGQTGTWRQITLFNIPVTNGQCTIGFQTWSSQGGTWLHFDDVTFTRQ